MDSKRKSLGPVVVGAFLALVMVLPASTVLAVERTPRVEWFRNALSQYLAESGSTQTTTVAAPSGAQSISFSFKRLEIGLRLEVSVGGCPKDEKLDEFEGKLEDFAAGVAAKFGFTDAELVTNVASISCDDGDITAVIYGLWVRE